MCALRECELSLQGGEKGRVASGHCVEAVLLCFLLSLHRWNSAFLFQTPQNCPLFLIA